MFKTFPPQKNFSCLLCIWNIRSSFPSLCRRCLASALEDLNSDITRGWQLSLSSKGGRGDAETDCLDIFQIAQYSPSRPGPCPRDSCTQGTLLTEITSSPCRPIHQAPTLPKHPGGALPQALSVETHRCTSGRSGAQGVLPNAPALWTLRPGELMPLKIVNLYLPS